MLSTKPGVNEALDRAAIGFLTAVRSDGQPQTSPVWFIRDGDELVVYNRAESRRLVSIGDNDRISFNLRGDRAAGGLLILEGVAAVDRSLPRADQSPAYLDKYGPSMEKVSGSRETFANDYSVGIRIAITRIRVWNIERVIQAEI